MQCRSALSRKSNILRRGSKSGAHLIERKFLVIYFLSLAYHIISHIEGWLIIDTYKNFYMWHENIDLSWWIIFPLVQLFYSLYRTFLVQMDQSNRSINDLLTYLVRNMHTDWCYDCRKDKMYYCFSIFHEIVIFTLLDFIMSFIPGSSIGTRVTGHRRISLNWCQRHHETSV